MAVLRVLGAALIVAGLVVLVQAFVRFVMEGVGTPAPVAPTEHLVVGGLYRYVRNPMYVAVGGDHRRAGARARPARAAALRRRLRRRHRAFARWYEEPALSGAVRRRVRGLPPRGARLVAAAAPVAPRRREASPRAPVPALRRPDVLAEPAHERHGGLELARGSCARLRTVQPGAERVAAGDGEALQRSRRAAGDRRVAARRAHELGLVQRQPAPSARARSPASSGAAVRPASIARRMRSS